MAVTVLYNCMSMFGVDTSGILDFVVWRYWLDNYIERIHNLVTLHRLYPPDDLVVLPVLFNDNHIAVNELFRRLRVRVVLLRARYVPIENAPLRVLPVELLRKLEQEFL